MTKEELIYKLSHINPFSLLSTYDHFIIDQSDEKNLLDSDGNWVNIDDI